MSSKAQSLGQRLLLVLLSFLVFMVSSLTAIWNNIFRTYLRSAFQRAPHIWLAHRLHGYAERLVVFVANGLHLLYTGVVLLRPCSGNASQIWVPDTKFKSEYCTHSSSMSDVNIRRLYLIMSDVNIKRLSLHDRNHSMYRFFVVADFDCWLAANGRRS